MKEANTSATCMHLQNAAEKKMPAIEYHNLDVRMERSRGVCFLPERIWLETYFPWTPIDQYFTSWYVMLTLLIACSRVKKNLISTVQLHV